ncbi:MAG: ABC transporter ATP-binding protein [Acidobacteria bacterium]|nr:ABC transporter ATP-binding protein [Acidobacteriota bacterium]
MTALETDATASSGARSTLLEVTDLSTSFRTERGLVHAVDGVTFTLDRGRTLGVVGESGSGKTVLSRSIMGLLGGKNVIREGSVRYEGTEIIDYSAKQMSSVWGAEMSMVFQDPMTSLNPVMKIGKQITESLHRHLDVEKDEARKTAVALLRSVGIPAPEQRLDEYPHQLSGGMRQRVTIAIALACGPKLLFADEPTTALDVTVQAQILDLLEAQQRDRHMAMILVTHDLGVVRTRADEIIVMYGGKVVEQAPTRTLFTEKKMPYTEALLHSIPRLDMPSHTRLDAIPGRPPNLIDPPRGCNFAPRCRYVQARCLEERPPLVAGDSPGHFYRCFFPIGSPENTEALARNQAAGTAVAAPAPRPTVSTEES